MALFFDSTWFDAQLSALGMTRDNVAAVLGLSSQEVSELWKDQRELKAHDVALLSSLIGKPATEIANRAGISTPLPRSSDGATGLEMLERRVARIESEIGEIQRLLREQLDKQR